MGVSLRWFIDGHVLAVEFTGALNEQSILEMIQQRKTLSYLRNNSPIHTILDFSQIDSFDLGIGQLNQLIGNLPQYCNSGFFVGVMNVENSLFLAVQFVSRIAMYQIGMPFKMCLTWDDAAKFLQIMDRDICGGDMASAS